MELEQMQTLWKTYDAKLDEALKLNRALLTEQRLDKARGALRRFLIFPVLDALFAFTLVVFAWTAAAHATTGAHVALAVALLLPAAHLFLAVSIRQIVLTGQADRAESVTESQRLLTALKVSRVRTIKWVLLLAPLMGFCVLVLGPIVLFGFDVAEHVHVPWLWSNFAFGLLFVPFGVWLTRRIADRFGDSTWMKRICDNMSGRNLQAATQRLEEVAAFEAS